MREPPYPPTPTPHPPVDWRNEELTPPLLLESARRNAGFSVQNMADVLEVSRQTILDMRTPGKIKNLDLVKVLKWCLACVVRPSWVDPQYEMHDVAVEAKLLDLNARGISFAKEHLGYDPRQEPAPRLSTAPVDLTNESLPEWLRVGGDGNTMRWFMPSLPFQVGDALSDEYGVDGIPSGFCYREN